MVSLGRGLNVGQGRLNFVESALTRILDKVLGAGIAVAVVLVMVWPLVFTGSIIAREIFLASTMFLEEYTGFWTLIITCLALGYTLRREGHIRVDTVVKYLPHKVRCIVEVFVAFIAIIVSCIMTAYTFELLIFAIRQDIHSSYSSTPLWPIYLFMPVGYGLLSVALFLYFWRTMLVVLGKD